MGVWGRWVVIEAVLAEGDVRGLIFDCDGTLADSMPPHYVAWSETLTRYGLSLDEDEFYRMGGWPTVVVARHLIERAGATHDPEQLMRDKEARFQEILHTVQPIQPVVAVVRHFERRLPMAVASGGIGAICRQTLDYVGLGTTFEAVVTADDVTRHKPEPDVFLEAARRIGIAPAQCLVFEDAEPGLEAARRAGMRVIDIRRWFTPRRISG